MNLVLCCFSQAEGTKLQKDLKAYLTAVKSECLNLSATLITTK